MSRIRFLERISIPVNPTHSFDYQPADCSTVWWSWDDIMIQKAPVVHKKQASVTTRSDKQVLTFLGMWFNKFMKIQSHNLKIFPHCWDKSSGIVDGKYGDPNCPFKLHFPPKSTFSPLCAASRRVVPCPFIRILAPLHGALSLVPLSLPPIPPNKNTNVIGGMFTIEIWKNGWTIQPFSVNPITRISQYYGAWI